MFFNDVRRFHRLRFNCREFGCMHYILFIITALIWGAAFFLMKKASFAFGPLTIGAASTFGGALVTLLFRAVKRSPWQIRSRHIATLFVVSVLGYIYPYAIQPFLVKLIGHGFIGMMVSLVPILTILVSIPLLGVLPSRTQLAGVLIGICCIGLMVVDGLNRHAGFLYLMVAVSVPLCYAVSNTLVQKSLHDLTPIITVSVLMATAAIVLTPLAFLFETITVDQHFLSAVGAIILLSIFARGIAMLLFYKLIQSKGPLFAGMVTYVIPTEALMWSWLDGERISLIQLTAIAIVLLMVGIVQSDIIRRGDINEKGSG